ncbi:essential protein yae1 [Diplodia corticola]|uniref:Protein YAE1 n=1 Tax=Diplodia corticola TaxID=236234 RepID=A0A1J9SA32_9PEZI|nr:essential protein yae1 [Diplodia corticola]OJD37343.1 essential protein yae1 [Diplodia corticola]
MAGHHKAGNNFLILSITQKTNHLPRGLKLSHHFECASNQQIPTDQATMLREEKGDMSPTTGFRASRSPPPPSPPLQNSVLDDIFGEPTTALPAAQQPAPTTSSQLDDIFGCSPPRDDDDDDPAGRPRNAAADDWPGTAASRDVSDIPRLRSVHVTAGYRDGLAESKAGHVQDGFDEGFPLGAVLGMKAGWALGVLEGVAVAFRAAALGKGTADGGARVAEAAEAFEAARRQLVEARKELDMVTLFGQEYFDEEGIWKYHVDGLEDEVTFEEVAAQHPLISKWLVAVDALVEQARIDLGVLDRRAREDPEDETTTAG